MKSITTILFVISLFILFLYLGRKHKKSFFSPLVEFSQPFFSRVNNSFYKSTWIFIFSILLPFIFFRLIFNEADFISYKLIDFKFFPIFYSIWIALLAIVISSRIYFEIGKKEKNFEEFISIIINDFIKPSKTNDKLFIIIPTFFIGWHKSKSFHIKFIEKIKEFATNKDIHLNLAMLSFEGLDTKKSITEIKEIKPEILSNDAEASKFLKMVENLKNYPLFDFHYNWDKDVIFIGNNIKIRYYFTLSILNTLDAINKLKNEPSNNFNLIHLEKEYFSDLDKNGSLKFTNNSDFFMFANTTKNNYFFGNLIIGGIEKIQFNSVQFSIKNISNEIESFFSNFIASRKKHR